MKNLFFALLLSFPTLLIGQSAAPDTIIAEIQIIKNTSGEYEIFYGKDMRFTDNEIFSLLFSSNVFKFDTIKTEEQQPKIIKL